MPETMDKGDVCQDVSKIVTPKKQGEASSQEKSTCVEKRKDTPKDKKENKRDVKNDVSKSSTRWSKESPPVSSGVANAKKKLRAFAIQKKLSQTSLCSPSSLLMKTPSKTSEKAPKAATVLIKSSGSAKTKPSTPTSVVTKPPGTVLKKPPLPKSDPDGRRRNAIRDMEETKRREFQLERMLELNIPLWLLPPDTVPELKCAHAMPTASMPPLKKLLSLEQMDEMFQRAEEYERKGIKIKFTLDRDTFKDPEKEIKMIAIRQDDNTPLDVEKKEEKEEPKQQDKKEESSRPLSQHRSSHSRLSVGSRRHSGRDDRGHRRKDIRHRHSEPSKDRPTKHSTKKPPQEVKPTEVISLDSDDFVICDSWSPENDSKDTTKLKKPSREVQKITPRKPSLKIAKSSQPKHPSPIILDKNLKALTMVAEYSSDSLDDFPDDDATVIGSPSLSERDLSKFKRSIYSPDPLSPGSDTRPEPKIASVVESIKPVIVKSNNLTPPTEKLLYLIEMAQPDVFMHSRSLCVKETKCQPSVMFAVSPKICKCVPKRGVFIKELSEKKTGLLEGLHAMESSSEAQANPIRDWYPTEQYTLTDRSTIELSTNWETDDSNPDQPKTKTKAETTTKPAPTPTPTTQPPLRKGNLIDYTNYTIEAPVATSPPKKKEGVLDEEYEKFMQAVWTDKTEEAGFGDDSVISSKGATTDRAYCSGSEMTKSLNDSSTKTSLYSEADFEEDSSEIQKIATPQKSRTEDIANEDSVPAKKLSSEYWSEDSTALPKDPIAVQSSSPKKKISPLKKKALPKKKTALKNKKKNEKSSKKGASKSSGSSESESSDSDSNSDSSSSSSSSSESDSNETGKKKTAKKVKKQSKKKVSKLKRLNKKKRLKRLKEKRLQKRLRLKKLQEEETLKKGKDGDKSKKKVVARKEDQPKKKPSPISEKEKEKKKKRRKSSSSSSSSSSTSSSSDSSNSSSSSDVGITTKETGKKSGAGGRSKELFSMETLLNIKRERTSEDEMQVTDFIPRRGRANNAQEIISVNQLHSDFVEKTQLIATIKQEPITSDWESPTTTQLPKLSETEPAKSPILEQQSEIEKQLPEIRQHSPEIDKQLPEIVKPLPRIEKQLPAIEIPLPEIEEPLPAIEEPLPEIEIQSPIIVQPTPEKKQPSAHTTVVDESIWNEFELMQNTLEITQNKDSSSDSSSDEDSSSSSDSSATSSVVKKSPESSRAAPRLYSIDDEQEEAAQAERFVETVTDSASMGENIEYEDYAAEDMVLPKEEPMVQHAIETVISSSGRGEIKCDWRPSEQHSKTVEKLKKPSRWGKKQEDAAKEKSNRYTDKERKDTGRHNVYRIKSILDPESPEEFQQSTSLVHPTEIKEVFKIETISSVHKKFSGNSPANSSYDRAYADMFGESDNLTYGNCFGDQNVQYQDVKFSPKPISLDERISMALQYLGGGDEAQPKSKPSTVKPEPAPLEDPPEKGILLLSGVPKPSRADPRITKPLKRVCFADGFLPGQDSDTEEPPIKKAKTVEKPVIKYGCAWPCPSWHEDYDPEWDELPPPPPPPGSPPPPEIPLMPLHLLRPPPLLNSMHLLPPLPHTADKKDDKSGIQTMPTVTRLPKVLSHPDTSK